MPFLKGQQAWNRADSDSKCLYCHKTFHISPSRLLDKKVKRGLFCSRECKDENQKEALKDSNNHFWKGDEAGYDAIHDWVKRRLGYPKLCRQCKTTEERVYHWANISGEYKRELSDWMRLCVPCHKNYDLPRKNKQMVYTPESKRMLRIRAV